MRRSATFAAGCLAAVLFLALAPGAMAQSAVDQYSESIPTAGGHKSSKDAISGGGTATIPPATEAQLQKSNKGAEAAAAAKITAQPRVGSGVQTGGSNDEGGLGLLLPLILAATAVTAVAIFIVRRRPGTTPG